MGESGCVSSCNYYFCNCDYLGDNCNDDIGCLLMASNDRLGLEAIKALHQQLDDDANGNVDLSESDDVSVSLKTYVT